MSLSLRPGFNRLWRRQDQFVTQVNYQNQTRTIVGEVEQRGNDG